MSRVRQRGGKGDQSYRMSKSRTNLVAKENKNTHFILMLSTALQVPDQGAPGTLTAEAESRQLGKLECDYLPSLQTLGQLNEEACKLIDVVYDNES